MEGSPEFSILETRVLLTHAHRDIVIGDSSHIDTARWQPLLYVFRHYFGTGPRLGRTLQGGILRRWPARKKTRPVHHAGGAGCRLWESCGTLRVPAVVAHGYLSRIMHSERESHVIRRGAMHGAILLAATALRSRLQCR